MLAKAGSPHEDAVSPAPVTGMPWGHCTFMAMLAIAAISQESAVSPGQSPRPIPGSRGHSSLAEHPRPIPGQPGDTAAWRSNFVAMLANVGVIQGGGVSPLMSGTCRVSALA